MYICMIICLYTFDFSYYYLQSDLAKTGNKQSLHQGVIDQFSRMTDLF